MRLFSRLATTGAVAVLVALGLWLAFAAFFRARGRTRGRDLPSWSPDDERPLGDTTELHDRLSPHDVPKGHPSRGALERAARADAR
jgi:hypothetical protein